MDTGRVKAYKSTGKLVQTIWFAKVEEVGWRQTQQEQIKYFQIIINLSLKYWRYDTSLLLKAYHEISHANIICHQVS